MSRVRWRDLAAAAATAVLFMSLAACSGSSGGSSTSTTTTTTTTPVNNVQPVIVDAGPSVGGEPVGYPDTLYTTVTICVPGTSTCQSIDHVLVDTGSSGLRILASEIAANFPSSTDSSGNPIGNCVQYVDTSYQWGPVVTADVKLAGEVASSVPIQIVGSPTFAAAPALCSAGGTPAQTALELGANGILGVGVFRQDCGPACASPASPPAYYFSCPAAGCTVTSVSLSAQLQNPVWLFPQDNNGLSIVLPQVTASGALTATGSMIFGIGTQTDNALGAAQAQATDDLGNFTTTYNGVAYTASYIDSGSSGIFFLDPTTTGLPGCSNRSIAEGLYCPGSAVGFSVINTGPNPNGSVIPVSTNVAFSIANALTLFNTGEYVFNNIGGPSPGVFDFGLPFFFGRTVFIGIESQNSAAGTGPYWAY
jgi:hypothetical protein